jgi:hypothetical protein
MSQSPRENRFEKHRTAIMAVFYSFISLVLLLGAVFVVKAMRDEAKRGYERYIVMREARPASDISKPPSKSLLAVVDGLEDRLYRLHVDGNGFIMPSKVHDKADREVVFLGGSTTECHYMDEDVRFPYLVGRELEKTIGLKINSYNGGHAGNNTLHCIFLLQGKVVPMHPRIAVLMEDINDLTSLMVLGGYWTPHATRGIVQEKEYDIVTTWVLKHFAGYKRLDTTGDDEFLSERKRLAHLDPAAFSEAYRKNIELFVFVCRQHGITPVLMTQFNRIAENLPDNLSRQIAPMREAWRFTYAQYRDTYSALNETVRAVAKEQNVALVDLDREVPKSPEFMYDIVHLNAKGSRRVAGVVAKALEPLVR